MFLALSVADIVVPIVIGVASVFVTFLAWVLRRHERAIDNNDTRITRLSRTVYGDDADSQQRGLSKDITDIKKELRNIREELRDE